MGDTLLEALTSSARDPLKPKLNQKLGMVLTDMVLIHTATATDTHTLMVDIMIRKVDWSNLTIVLKHSSYQFKLLKAILLNCIFEIVLVKEFQNKIFVSNSAKTVIKKTMK